MAAYFIRTDTLGVELKGTCCGQYCYYCSTASPVFCGWHTIVFVPFDGVPQVARDDVAKEAEIVYLLAPFGVRFLRSWTRRWLSELFVVTHNNSGRETKNVRAPRQPR